MAKVEFRTNSTTFGTSSTMAAVLVVLAYLTSSVCGDVCLQDPRPHNESVWNDKPTDINVTVVWTVESVIITLSKNYYFTDNNNNNMFNAVLFGESFLAASDDPDM